MAGTLPLSIPVDCSGRGHDLVLPVRFVSLALAHCPARCRSLARSRCRYHCRPQAVVCPLLVLQLPAVEHPPPAVAVLGTRPLGAHRHKSACLARL